MKVDLKTVQDTDNPIIKKCPYCGCETFYTNHAIKGKIRTFARYDGEEAANNEMYDGIDHILLGKFAYCADCNKKVFRFKK